MGDYKVSTEESVIERVRVGMRVVIPADWSSRVHLMATAEGAGRRLGIEFRTYLEEQTLAAQLIDIPAVQHVEDQVAIDVPASWWQRLKRDHMPAWFKRRWPVRVTPQILRARRTLTLREADRVTLTTKARYTTPGDLAYPDRPYILVHQLRRHA